MARVNLSLMLWLAYSTSCLIGGEPQNRRESRAEHLVRLALQHECAGEADLRKLRLRTAVMLAPDYAPVNWHSGRVHHDGGWSTVEEVRDRLTKDEHLAKYRQLRERAVFDVERQLQLARWCARNGFSERADLHYSYLLMNPNATAKVRQMAMDRLGLRELDGVFLSEQQIKQHRDTVKQIEGAMKKWRPRLVGWRNTIQTKTGKKYDRAARDMQHLDDPSVIPVLETFVLESGEGFGVQTVRLLGQFDQHDATQGLVRFALLSPWPAVRQSACRQLHQRPLHDYVPLLLHGLVASVKTRWRIVPQPDGTVKYDHLILHESPSHKSLIHVDQLGAAGVLDPDVRSHPSNNALIVRVNQAVVIERILFEAVPREAAIARFNHNVALRNQNVMAALEQTTGQLPQDANAWWEWWEQYNEVYTPQKTVNFIYAPSVNLSCFAAGTPIWTETGLVPIEQLQPGDRVLSQHPETGELAYKLVLQTTIRPPAPLLRVHVEGEDEGEDILTTKGHPFWVANQGWRMAKLLKAGEYLHGASGPLRVAEVELLKREQPAHNLVVADFSTYFVGKAAALVHDNSYRTPTRARVPGYIPD